jgi:branched-chain amino acid aminotransferase
MASVNPTEKLKGIRLDVAEYRRPDPKTAPCASKATGLYVIRTISKHAAEAKGYADAMMLDYRGQVAEATDANIFFIKDGVIHTPTPDCFLNGITRQTVIELAKRRGSEVIDRAILPEELPSFSECFLTGSAAEVTPVSEIGPHRFTPSTISETWMNDDMKEVYPAAVAAGETLQAISSAIQSVTAPHGPKTRGAKLNAGRAFTDAPAT